MTTERLTMLLAAASLIGQFSVYLLSGSFTIGEKLTTIEADIKSLKIESLATNKIQSHRLIVIERRLDIPTDDTHLGIHGNSRYASC